MGNQTPDLDGRHCARQRRSARAGETRRRLDLNPGGRIFDLDSFAYTHPESPVNVMIPRTCHHWLAILGVLDWMAEWYLEEVAAVAATAAVEVVVQASDGPGLAIWGYYCSGRPVADCCPAKGIL